MTEQYRTEQDRTGPSEPSSAVFPQWNSAVQCDVRSDQSSTSGSCGAEVDGDGDDDCTLTAMTLYSGTLQGWLHICINRVGGSILHIHIEPFALTKRALQLPENTC